MYVHNPNPSVWLYVLGILDVSLYPVWHLVLDTRLKPTIEMAGPVVNVTFLRLSESYASSNQPGTGSTNPSGPWSGGVILPGALVGSPIFILTSTSLNNLALGAEGWQVASPHLHESMVAAWGLATSPQFYCYCCPNPFAAAGRGRRPPGPGLEFHKGSPVNPLKSLQVRSGLRLSGR